ncbi:MAG: hypothetical protein JWM71_994, partial [Solirubrobacteraceae bacterium]|nr:hypothetical protein [Solirubrobacteraceae bacterium]
MLAGAQGRTIWAGVGTSGSLLAAIATVFALTAGVLGFKAWPASSHGATNRGLAVAPAAVSRAAL